VGGFLFEFFGLLGAFGFGEPPMCIEVRSHQGQDDGNKHNKGDVETHVTGVKLLIGTKPVNL
jgi:hypothetical protein